MEKQIVLQSANEKGVFCYLVGTNDTFLTKTAAEYHPTIASYISQAKPITGKTQILLTALGAYEYWGSNSNGDAFKEEDLAYDGPEYGFRTFVTHAKLYKHHVNKDPTKSYGHVALAVYNSKYHRVELIVVVDNEKAPDIAERINNGDLLEFSMGTKVKYDVCSICGNKAPTRAQYCEHLKYYMGRIHPGTGKLAFAFNPKPVFFDISHVLIGADKIAKGLLKVASLKSAAEVKHATIEKQVPANEAPGSVYDVVKAIPEVKAREIPIENDTIDELAEQHKAPKVLSTMIGMGILPKPREFQRIILVSSGMKPVANELEERGMHFDPEMDCSCNNGVIDRFVDIRPENFSDMIVQKLLPFMEQRSYARPHLTKRIIIMSKTASAKEYDVDMIKLGNDKNDYPKDVRTPVPLPVLMALIAGAYASLTKDSPKKVTSMLGRALHNPLIAASIGASVPAMFNHLIEPRSKGTMNNNIEPEITSVLDRVDENKRKPFLKIGMSRASTGLALTFGAPGLAYMTSNYLNKSMRETPDYSESKVKKFVRKYPELVGAMSAVEGINVLRNKPGLANYALKAKDFMRGLKKTGSAGEFLADSLVIPLAMGGAHLPSRIAGSMLDQAVFAGSKKLLSKKNNNNTIVR